MPIRLNHGLKVVGSVLTLHYRDPKSEKDLKIKIKRVRHRKDAISLPKYMSDGAAGMDLFADLEEEVALSPLERKLIPTGIAVALPIGFEAQIRPRSGFALKNGITLINSPGTIDSDYRGEIKLITVNFGNSTVVIQRGERLAQMVVQRVYRVQWQEVKELPASERQEEGFGHTDQE